MSLLPSVAAILRKHVTMELECIDRMYLNVIVPQLQYEGGVVSFFRHHRGDKFASSARMDPITRAFVDKIQRFIKEKRVELVAFKKGERKDDIALDRLAKFQRAEGVIFVGRAQEKTPVFRTEKRRDERTGATYPWIVRSTAMVNHYYFYCLDADFGPFFIKFCTYFPYTAKLCINGHEYLKRQLAKHGIRFEALDNGILSCTDQRRLQRLADGLSAEKIDALLRKWLGRLPHPFPPADRAAGYRYQLFVLQAEFSLTQVLDRPATGRVFFEEVIRENLDLGRPDQVQLIFDRRVTRKTPSRFRTRVVMQGVTPCLHVDYKHSRIKQYFKLLRALRTETTINDTRDFGIGKRLSNLPALRRIGFAANRRLLDVQRISHDCAIGEDAIHAFARPACVAGQRVSAIKFLDPFVQALLGLLADFRLLPAGFANKDLRERLAPLLGIAPSQLTQGRMTYQLRRLRLRGLIERIKKTHRYRVTDFGLRSAIFFTKLNSRILRPGLASVAPASQPTSTELRRAFDNVERAMDHLVLRARIAG
jgi:hypothetical protein